MVTTPALTRKIGNKTFEVFVHFSETSKETLTDKIMQLVHNMILRSRAETGNGRFVSKRGSPLETVSSVIS